MGSIQGAVFYFDQLQVNDTTTSKNLKYFLDDIAIASGESLLIILENTYSRLQICPHYIFGNKATDGT